MRDYEQLLAAAGRLLARAQTSDLAADDPRLRAVESIVSGEVQGAAWAFAAAINDQAGADTAGGAR